MTLLGRVAYNADVILTAGTITTLILATKHKLVLRSDCIPSLGGINVGPTRLQREHLKADRTSSPKPPELGRAARTSYIYRGRSNAMVARRVDRYIKRLSCDMMT